MERGDTEIFAADDQTGTLQAVWKVKEQLRVLLRTGSLEDAAAAKEELEILRQAASQGSPRSPAASPATPAVEI